MQAFKSKFPDHVHSHACKALAKDIETASASKPDFGKPRQEYIHSEQHMCLAHIYIYIYMI
jgi:hypothetical protein